MRWLLLLTAGILTAHLAASEPKFVLKDGSSIPVDNGAVGEDMNMLVFRSENGKMMLSKALVDWAATWQKMPEVVVRFRPEIASKQKKHVRRKTDIAITKDSLESLEPGQGLTDEWTQDPETARALAYVKANKDNPKKKKEKKKPAKKSQSGGGAPVIDVITHGDEVTLADHLEKDMYVIFDFYADWCGPCKRLDPKLKAIVKKYPGHIGLKKIDIIQWQSPVAMQFRINSIPYLKLYDPDGKELLDGGGDGILSYLEQTARRDKW